MASSDAPTSRRPGDWSFATIGEPFDEHVRAHLPGYEQLQDLIVAACAWRMADQVRVLDVGCATGETLCRLAQEYGANRFWGVGIDSDPGMIRTAETKLDNVFSAGHHTIRFHRANAEHMDRKALFETTADAEKVDIMLAIFSLQFIDPPRRKLALNRMAAMLNRGALVIIAEKCMPETPESAELWSGLYADWKIRNEIPAADVLEKWSRLRGQLIPWRAGVYERWARDSRLRGDLIWAWGPFRAWAWWREFTDM